MSTTVTVYPVEGRTVRDPATGEVVTAEKEVPRSAYWLRRLRSGDLTTTPPAGKPAAKPSSSSSRGSRSRSASKDSTD